MTATAELSAQYQVASSYTRLRATLDLEGRIARVADKALRRDQKEALVSRLEPVKHLLGTMKTATKSRECIAQEIACTYPDVQLFTPSLVDFEGWVKRRKRAPLEQTATVLDRQIEYHGQVSVAAARGAIPGTTASFHSLVPFNPIPPDRSRDLGASKEPWTDALERVKRAIGEHGFVGVKLYPPCGFLPIGNEQLREFEAEAMWEKELSVDGRRLGRLCGGRGPLDGWLSHDHCGTTMDAAMRALYSYCEAEAVPILTHASNGNSFFRNAAWRASPWGWRRVLKEFPNLHLCFGHFGNLQGIEGYTDPVSCVAWAEGFLELMLEYDHVYADISDSTAGAGGPKDVKERDEYQRTFLYWLCRRLADPDAGNGAKLAQRLMYGSDWWMGKRVGNAEFFLKNICQMVDESMNDAISVLDGAANSTKVDFKRDFWGVNALRFLGIIDDAGEAITDKGNGRRLRDFYKTHAAGRYPTWLNAGSG